MSLLQPELLMELPEDLVQVPRLNALDKLPAPAWPTNIERDYQKALEGYAEGLVDLVERAWPTIKHQLTILELERTNEARVDDEVQQIEIELSKLLTAMTGVLTDAQIKQLASMAMGSVRIFAVQQVGKEFRSFAINPYVNNAELTSLVRARVAENVSLIKSIPAQYHDKIQRAVIKGVTQGKPSAAIAEDIFKLGQSTLKRAKFIARDQVATMLGETQVRLYQQNGLKRGRWWSLLDGREREEHGLLGRHNKIFNLETGINGEFPGTPINCRCITRPVVEDLIQIREEPGTPLPAGTREAK